LNNFTVVSCLTKIIWIEKNFPYHFYSDHAVPHRHYLYPDQLDSNDGGKQADVVEAQADPGHE
jgi:hypothetical protein